MEASGAPHEALYYVLAYLPLQQLLQMKQVSKSLRDCIKDDVLVWLNFVVENPLSRRLIDPILLNITSKAHGRLQTLALLNCFKITDQGLLNVVNANPFLTKLYVPACTGLTPEGILEAVETLTTRSTSSISIKINGIYNINKEHLHILQSYITTTTSKPEPRPRFYHKYWSSSFRSLDDDDTRVIDVELCPKCGEVKLVFHCSNETDCIGCIECIPRCEVCGKCVSVMGEIEHEETLCNDVVCLDCWLQLPKCNHCNKPFCPRHADEHHDLLHSQGFVCEVCQMKSLTQYEIE